MKLRYYEIRKINTKGGICKKTKPIMPADNKHRLFGLILKQLMIFMLVLAVEISQQEELSIRSLISKKKLWRMN